MHTCITKPVLTEFYVCVENKAVGVMKPGHVFTIEPMICEGKSLLKSHNLICHKSFILSIYSGLSAVVYQAGYISEERACVLV